MHVVHQVTAIFYYHDSSVWFSIVVEMRCYTVQTLGRDSVCKQEGLVEHSVSAQNRTQTLAFVLGSLAGRVARCSVLLEPFAEIVEATLACFMIRRRWASSVCCSRQFPSFLVSWFPFSGIGEEYGSFTRKAELAASGSALAPARLEKDRKWKKNKKKRSSLFFREGPVFPGNGESRGLRTSRFAIDEPTQRGERGGKKKERMGVVQVT